MFFFYKQIMKMAKTIKFTSDTRITTNNLCLYNSSKDKQLFPSNVFIYH